MARNETVVATAEAALEAQAVIAWATERQQRMLARLVGRRTPAQRRQWRERQARQQRRAEAGDGQPGERTGQIADYRPMPQVFWEEGGRGPVLLLLNGWSASGRVWPSAWLRRLEEHFRVIRIDNRGSGLSRTAPAPFTMANLAEDAADVLAAVGAGPATVLGVSMGGMIAQELALRRPDTVERLVLGATRPPAPAQVSGAGRALGRPRSGQPLEPFVRSMWSGCCAPGFAEREPAIIDEVVAQTLERPTPRDGATDQMWAVACWHGARRLAAITAPTVVVHGDRDPLTPVGNGQCLARLIGGARYVELAGVGHLVAHEAGDALLDVLLDGA